MRLFTISICLLALLLSAGCKDPTPTEHPPENTQISPPDASPAETPPTPKSATPQAEWVTERTQEAPRHSTYTWDIEKSARGDLATNTTLTDVEFRPDTLDTFFAPRRARKYSKTSDTTRPDAKPKLPQPLSQLLSWHRSRGLACHTTMR